MLSHLRAPQTSEVAAQPLLCQPARMVGPFTHSLGTTFDRGWDITPREPTGHSQRLQLQRQENNVCGWWENARPGPEPLSDASRRASAHEPRGELRWVTNRSELFQLLQYLLFQIIGFIQRSRFCASRCASFTHQVRFLKLNSLRFSWNPRIRILGCYELLYPHKLCTKGGEMHDHSNAQEKEDQLHPAANTSAGKSLLWHKISWHLPPRAPGGSDWTARVQDSGKDVLNWDFVSQTYSYNQESLKNNL